LADDDHEVHSWHPEITGGTESLPNKSFAAISVHGRPHLSGGHHAETGRENVDSSVENQDEMRCADTPPLPLRFLEFEMSANSLRGVQATGGRGALHYFW
jgi:hypothetical protein